MRLRGGALATPLAWSNVVHSPLRTALSVGGVAAAAVLLFMQLGLYAAAAISGSRILDTMGFDAVLASPHYLSLSQAGRVDRSRLGLARAVVGVREVVPLHAELATWRKAETGRRYTIMVLGIDPARHPFSQQDVATGTPLLHRQGTALSDLEIGPAFQALAPGREAKINDRSVDIVGGYRAGPGFAAKALLVVSDTTFPRLLGAEWRDVVSLGLVRFASDTDGAEVAAALRSRMPPDVIVWTRDEIYANERNYYLSVKPIGIMFTSGVLIALLVSAVILFQILSAEVRNHLGEYATLMALGYSSVRTKALVIEQGVLFALLGFLPASLGAVGLYRLLHVATKLPMFMTWQRVALVFFLTVGASVLSSILAVRRIDTADPAELFLVRHG